ncbi:cytochrome P450 [Mitsuaria sp. WAJ17]|uniref:cytochrome P450 n=1 Tax=Mitsuaria sp. WAJ17 TaxID=2761452 RepID=UPI001600AAC2|nr:cytochrome P450 [Mitsuaria sp. WAJ17]MBB2487724.1 cytochrome P450 [Mitsuaria sp. WAJ17]
MKPTRDATEPGPRPGPADFGMPMPAAGAFSNPARPLRELAGPPGWPLLGHLPILDRRRLQQQLEHWAGTHGPLYRLQLGRRPVLVVADHQLAQDVMRRRPQRVLRSPTTRRVCQELGVDGLFMSEGERWQALRRLTVRAFTPEMLRGFHPRMLTIGQRWRERWVRALQAGRQPDLARDLPRFSLEVGVALAMGVDLGAGTAPGQAQAGAGSLQLQADIEFLIGQVWRRINATVPLWRWFKTAPERAVDAAITRVRQALLPIIEQARAHRAAQPEAAPRHLLDALLIAQARPEAGERPVELTDEQLVRLLTELVFAGEDTSAHSLAWLMSLASRHPGAWQQLQTEIAQACPPEGPDYDSLRRLPYAEALIQESQRLKPVISLLMFQSAEDQVVGGVLVPKGAGLMTLNRYSALRQGPEDRHDFRPERWLTLDGQAPCASSMPFGAGARTCPGRYAALLQMKTLLALMAPVLDLLPTQVPLPEEVMEVTLRPATLDLRWRLRGATA